MNDAMKEAQTHLFLYESAKTIVDEMRERMIKRLLKLGAIKMTYIVYTDFSDYEKDVYVLGYIPPNFGIGKHDGKFYFITDDANVYVDENMTMVIEL